MRIANLQANKISNNHGTIRGGSFLSAIQLFQACISTIHFTSSSY